jgi:hypothetical protein
MRSAIVFFIAFIGTVTAIPTKVERDAPAGATILPGSCTLGAVACSGTGMTKCGHAGLFFFPCGAGTHCEVPEGANDPTCVAN